ncbi:hypothetical protein N866_06840 [Actinotalea ferrariae CF5-4]|uniref:Uncharacterized protein n=1 Tax=Actinotalea ferrariae CF5-4 TaxID=948458 RepID=A0A021VU71_9CELL|nr:hypothetical protein [Actinotalea ferrariae]EYR62617.1 hypothetical protein N866_06840 [Actinotalea ferrariae CF5-4]
MAKIVFQAAEGLISDGQYAAAYELADKCQVGIALWRNSGGLARRHRFSAEGSMRDLLTFIRQVPSVFPHADTSSRMWLTLLRASRER